MRRLLPLLLLACLACEAPRRETPPPEAPAWRTLNYRHANGVIHFQGNRGLIELDTLCRSGDAASPVGRWTQSIATMDEPSSVIGGTTAVFGTDGTFLVEHWSKYLTDRATLTYARTVHRRYRGRWSGDRSGLIALSRPPVARTLSFELRDGALRFDRAPEGVRLDGLTRRTAGEGAVGEWVGTALGRVTFNEAGQVTIDQLGPTEPPRRHVGHWRMTDATHGVVDLQRIAQE